MSHAGDSSANPYAAPEAPAISRGVDPLLRLQLSVMMFLQYFVWGSWAVTLVTYLIDTRKFSAGQVAAVYATGPLATILAPLFVGIIADRFFATQRVLGVLHLLGAGLMYLVSLQTGFEGLRWLVLLYFLCYMPTIALTNSLSFHHLSDPDQQFPGIRVIGTIGWIAAGWLVGLAHLENANTPMQIAAASSLLLGLYCFFLPHTPPKATGPISISKLMGLDAIKLMRRYPFAVFIVSSFLICIPLQFYYNWANKYLNEIGMPVPAAIQTIGQIVEIFFLLIMPWCFVRLGVKKMLLVGMAAWAARYVMFAFGNSDDLSWLVVLGLLLHGVCFDFFFVTGFIYVDRNAPIELRASAQGFLSLVTWGISGWLGAQAGGLMAEYAKLPSGGYDWRTFWLLPAAAAGAVTLLFAVTFFDPKYDRGAPS